MPTFDIGAKLVTSQQKAWVVHAGRSRQDFPDFESSNKVYLEVPYLQLENQAINNRSTIRQAIRRSEAWLRHHQTFGSAAPSTTLSDYSDTVFEDSALTALTGSVSRLFGQVRAGDLVVSPGRDVQDGLRRSVLLIGEIVGDFDATSVHNGSRDQTQQVLFRNVKWLTKIARRDISLHLEGKIGKPPAVRQIIIDRDTEELLSYAYKSYIFDGSSSSLVRGERYDGEDFVVLNQSSDLIALLVAAHAVFDGAHEPHPITNLALFTRENYRKSAIDNIVVDFASPGHWRIIGASATLAAFVGLGIAVFTSGLSAQDLLQGIDVTNSVSAATAQDASVAESMNLFLNSIDYLELQNAIDIANDAKDKIGLRSTVDLVP